MRIIGKTLATKGVLGIRKAWSLATKGILDRFGGSEQKFGLNPEDVEFQLIIKGKKKFFESLENKLLGIKEFQFEKDLNLKAQISKDEFVNFDIKGKKEYLEKVVSFIIARRQIEVLEQWQIDSQKLLEESLEKSMIGSIQKDIEQSFHISSRKAIKEEYNTDIQGGKVLEFAYEKSITGQKDLSPIFLLLEDE